MGSKEELLGHVFERTIESFRTGLRRIIAQDMPAQEKLLRIIRYQVTLLADHMPFLTVFFSEETGLPVELARRVAREKRDYDHAIEAVVREGIAEGRIRDVPPTLLVFALLGLCNWLYKWYRPDGRLTADQIADVFADLLERGYLQPSSAGESVGEGLRRIEGRFAKLQHARGRRSR